MVSSDYDAWIFVWTKFADTRGLGRTYGHDPVDRGNYIDFCDMAFKAPICRSQIKNVFWPAQCEGPAPAKLCLVVYIVGGVIESVTDRIDCVRNASFEFTP